MDEMVIVNLGVFFTSFTCSYYSITCSYYSSPALTIPFPPVNKFPNKLAPNVPSNILKNLPFVL